MDTIVKYDPVQDFASCTLCPRECQADRKNGNRGYCKGDDKYHIAAVCLHHGEEPPVSGKEGICNVFFSNCNLQCIYCQNYQISDNRNPRIIPRLTLEEVTRKIIAFLDQGVRRIGLVSPSHCIPQVKSIIQAVRSSGYHPVWVYNTNGYDKAETIRSLEGWIDVWLPDFKYMDARLARSWSGAENYPEVVTAALREMFRQKGSTLLTDEQGGVESGLIIRHLVLPGQVENSLKILRFIARELSPRIHLSLMSQYYPTPNVADHPLLGKTLAPEEYLKVTEEMEKLEMEHGWIQDFDSSFHYRPDFDRDHPFDGERPA